MRIVFLAPSVNPVSSKTGGSVEIAIYQLAKRISKIHHVTVISRKKTGLPAVSKKGNLTIVRLQRGKKYIARAISYLKNHDFDLLQVENRPRYVTIMRNHFPNKPICLMIHSLTFMGRLSEQDQLESVHKATLIICNSNFIANYYRYRFPLFAHKFVTIYLGVDLVRFSVPPIEQKEKLLQDVGLANTFNILYVGRIVPKKGVHILIRAVGIVKRKYPNVRLLVGHCKNATYRKQLEAESIAANIDLSFIGGISPAKINRAYLLGHCFVCPTQFEEAFGLVNIEAMASGLPVIASKRGGIPEIIDQSNGILVSDYENPEAFAAAIEALMESPDLSEELAINGVNTVWSKFSWDYAAREFSEIYQILLRI